MTQRFPTPGNGAAPVSSSGRYAVFAVFIPLYLFLAWRNPWTTPSVPALLFFANAVILGHVHLGAFVMTCRLPRPAGRTGNLLDGLMTLLLYGSVPAMAHPGPLALLYTLFFSLVVLKYALLARQPLAAVQRDYIRLKLRSERVLVPLLAGLAVAAFASAGHPRILTGLNSLMAAAATGFFLWLAVFMKAYHWAFRRS